MIRPSTMADVVRTSAFWRLASRGPAGRGGHKEWFHFVVHREQLTALVNFSVCEGDRARERFAGDTGQLLCLVHAGGWHGSFERFASDQLRVRRGALDVHLGASSVVFAAGAFELRARPPDDSFEITLRLTPLAYPTPSHNVSFDDCPPLAWLAVPRLSATGVIRIGDQHFLLDAAPAYHDHNWGEFRWGADFVWEWGFAVPSQPSNPFSAVFTRFMTRSRTTDLARGLLVWRDATPIRIFRDFEIEVQREGFLGTKAVMRLPAAMSLGVRGSATDVPKRLLVSARRSNDWLDLSFEASELAQIVLPNDEGLGMTCINEVIGRITVEGVIEGERVATDETTTFEFMSD